MKRIEPNLLLALTTGLALALLTTSAIFAGPADAAAKYIGVAVMAPVAFVLLNGLWSKRTRALHPPLIHAEAPRSMMLWASLFPLSIMLAAAAPLFWPGRDLGLLVIIAAIWFGVTVESAIKARKAAAAS